MPACLFPGFFSPQYWCACSAPFLVFVLIPLTSSITQGVIRGFWVYTVIKLVLGKAREIHTIVYFIDAFALLMIAVGL